MYRRGVLAGTGTVLATIAGCVNTRSVSGADAESRVQADRVSTADTASNGSEQDGSDDDNASNGDETADDRAAVGELIEGAGFQLVVLDIRRKSTYEGLTDTDDETTGIGITDDDDERTARDGFEFLVVELAVKNTSQDAFRSVVDLVAPDVRDAEGRSHSRHESASSAILETNQLAPGEVERFELVYEVPTDTSVPRLTLVDEESERAALDRSTVDLEDEADTIASLEHDFRVPLQEFGESVERDGVTVSVDQLELGNDLGVSTFAQPAEDHEHIIVGFTVTNESGSELELSTLEQFHLKDELGRNYREEPDVFTSLEQFDDTDPLEEGERRTGKLAYEVERGLDELFWIVDFSQWGDGDRTIWRLR